VRAMGDDSSHEVRRWRFLVEVRLGPVVLDTRDTQPIPECRSDISQRFRIHMREPTGSPFHHDRSPVSQRENPQVAYGGRRADIGISNDTRHILAGNPTERLLDIDPLKQPCRSHRNAANLTRISRRNGQIRSLFQQTLVDIRICHTPPLPTYPAARDARSGING
jgi:hypothetical protein